LENKKQRKRRRRRKIIRKLIWIAHKFFEGNIDIDMVERPLLVDSIRKLIKCSKSTAYRYANSLIVLFGSQFQGRIGFLEFSLYEIPVMKEKKNNIFPVMEEKENNKIIEYII